MMSRHFVDLLFILFVYIIAVYSISPFRSCISDQSPFKVNPNQAFNDPAIMSARLASPIHPQNVREVVYSNHPSVDTFPPQHLGYGPPPGLSFADNGMASSSSPADHHVYGVLNGPLANLEVSQTSGSAHVRKLYLRP